MSAIATINNQIICFEKLIVKIGSRRLYARRLLDLISRLESRLEGLVKLPRQIPRQTEGQKIHEFLLGMGWKWKVDDDGRYWFGGFKSRLDPNRIYLIKYRPVGVRDGGKIKVKIMLASETISIYTHDKEIFGLTDLKRFIQDIKDIAYYR